MECLDCKISNIPEGHSGFVFLQCTDRAGTFYLCSKCWMKRERDLKNAELERRQKLIEEEQKAHSGKKKKGPKRGGSTQMGSSH